MQLPGAHHEKNDGSGYPLCLTGDQIPRVAWVNQSTLPRKKDFPPGFGVAFVDLEVSDRRRLLAYVDNLLGRKGIAASSPPVNAGGERV